jgi:hypothetical protein
MAPVAKRLTISDAGSTSSSGTGVRPISSAERDGTARATSSAVRPVRSPGGRTRDTYRNIAAHRVLQVGDDVSGAPDMALAAETEGVFAADVQCIAVDWCIAEKAAGGGPRFRVATLLEADAFNLRVCR